MKVYISIKAKAKSTGFGVTEEDTRNGVRTVTHKLESMSTCYTRMDALCGHPPKFTPVDEVCLGDPPAQEQDERQESITAPSRRHRLIDEEKQEEEDDDVIPTQDRGGVEEGNAVNTCTHDDNAGSRSIDNTIDDDFNDSFTTMILITGKTMRGRRALLMVMSQAYKRSFHLIASFSAAVEVSVDRC